MTGVLKEPLRFRAFSGAKFDGAIGTPVISG